jgi:hypothetical protein
MQVELGQKVQDVVSGFTGIAVGIHHFLNGCTRVSVAPPVDKEGKMQEEKWFDIQQIMVVDAQKVLEQKPEAKKTGGPVTQNPPRM